MDGLPSKWLSVSGRVVSGVVVSERVFTEVILNERVVKIARFIQIFIFTQSLFKFWFTCYDTSCE